MKTHYKEGSIVRNKAGTITYATVVIGNYGFNLQRKLQYNNGSSLYEIRNRGIVVTDKSILVIDLRREPEIFGMLKKARMYFKRYMNIMDVVVSEAWYYYIKQSKDIVEKLIFTEPVDRDCASAMFHELKFMPHKDQLYRFEDLPKKIQRKIYLEKINSSQFNFFRILGISTN